MELERDLVLRLPMVPYCVTYSAAERGRANGESQRFRVSFTLLSSARFFDKFPNYSGIPKLENEHGRCMTEVTRDRCNL